MLKSKFPEMIERAIEKPFTPVLIIFLRLSSLFTELFPITLILSTFFEISLRSSQSASKTPFSLHQYGRNRHLTLQSA